MKYEKIVQGVFIERPNRFVAKVEIDSRIETVHVKNTGRCRELLPAGATVYLADEEGKTRKTRYDLVAALKESRIINMDSQAPNAVVKEALQQGLILRDVISVKPEFTYGDSRFDFFVQTANHPKGAFIEVKGVTLEKNNVALFPDAPTERGIKHIKELINATRIGYKTFIIFIIQMADVKYFSPNVDTHKEFTKTLKEAAENNVSILAYDCNITPNSIELSNNITIKLI